jgi:hypothetical protein
MLVKATRLGYYNDRRQPEGSVFKLVDKKKILLVDEKNKKTGKMEKVKKQETIKAEKQFSSNWMEKVDDSDVAQEILDHAESVAEEAKANAQADVI